MTAARRTLLLATDPQAVQQANARKRKWKRAKYRSNPAWRLAQNAANRQHRAVAIKKSPAYHALLKLRSRLHQLREKLERHQDLCAATEILLLDLAAQKSALIAVCRREGLKVH